MENKKGYIRYNGDDKSKYIIQPSSLIRLLIGFLVVCKSVTCFKWNNYEIAIYPCPINTMCNCANLPNNTYMIYEISCQDVSLYKFPEILYNSVRHIEISNNFLQSVDDETFQGLRLESLQIANNKIQLLTARSFSSMTHSLLSLDISGNKLQLLPLEAIKNIYTLSRLNAQRNHIQNLNGDWGVLVDSLRSLYLSKNSLTELRLQFNEPINNTSNNLSSFKSLVSTAQPTRKPFNRLRKLVWLDMSLNRISYVNQNFLPKQLITLDLSGNILQDIPSKIVDRLPDLKILLLRDNLISDVSDVMFLMHKVHLEKLDLSLNTIESLPLDALFNGTMFVKAITLDRNYIRVIPADVFNNLGIVHMVLAFNLIENINEYAFRNLEYTLEYLDLERNRLTSVPIALTILNKLRYLYLTSNAISTIHYLPNTLRVLSLAGNNFTTIPINALHVCCSNLSYLNMGYNKISEIPENVFIGWGNQLQTLLLRNNKITRLNYETFTGLESIKEISLSFNDIHFVHPSVFEFISKTLQILELSFGIYREDFPLEQLKCLTELVWLGLDNNNLKSISHDSLATLNKLAYINLSFNRIYTLPANVFAESVHVNLMDIDLSYNIIEMILAHTFDGLSILHTVNLASNRIQRLEYNSFHNLPYLYHVDLSWNQLRNVSENTFTYLPGLMQLDLMYNQIESFTLRTFKHVSNETIPLKLNISHNKLTVFDGEINSFLYIQLIDASYNLLWDIQQCFKNVGNVLRVLYLNDNNISSLMNHAFEGLALLEILDLSNNSMTLLRRRSFQGLDNLQQLYLNDNEIDQLQGEPFSNLRNLRVLNLGNNKIKTLPPEAFINTRIEYINLSGNMLSMWPQQAFSDIGFTLRSIQLADNSIEYLESKMFISIQFLQDLNVSNNRITILPDNTFTHLMNLTNLDISYNPLIVTNIQEILQHASHLQVLRMIKIGLYDMPNILFLKYLTELDVSGNQLKNITTLKEMNFLRVLNVANNEISDLTLLVDLLPQSLRVLNIAFNPLKKILIQDMTKLRYVEDLDISNIRISNPSIFEKLTHIKVIRLLGHHNFSESIQHLRGLQELYIDIAGDIVDDYTLIKMINLTKLRLVEITGKHLTTITSNALYGLSRAHQLTIRITSTQITEFPAGLFYALKEVPHLTIDITNNKLTTLSPESFYPNATTWDAMGTRSVIGGLDLFSNPLKCDCGLVWLGHWLRRWLRETAQVNSIPKNDLQHMLMRARRNLCFDPLTGQQLPFLEIFPEDLLCHASALSSSATDNHLLHMISLISFLAQVLNIYLLLLL